MLFPKKVLIGIQEGRCNLKCPKCYTHGANRPSENLRPTGIMDRELFARILDECQPHRPRIAPQTWDEPLLNPDILDYLAEIKKRNLPVTMDTNGLLLTDRIIDGLIALGVDSVFVSIDAYTATTLEKTRGITNLEGLRRRVLRFLERRGGRAFPRIGVSFVVEEANRGERDAFVEEWSRHVDVVRVNELFQRDRSLTVAPAHARTPCWSLWDSLMIHPDGEAALCCVDTHYQTRIGNVKESGVAGVWNGPFFGWARKCHEQGEAGRIPICGTCTLWSNDEPVDRSTPELVIKATSTHTYYNRRDRLENMIRDNRYFK